MIELSPVGARLRDCRLSMLYNTAIKEESAIVVSSYWQHHTDILKIGLVNLSCSAQVDLANTLCAFSNNFVNRRSALADWCVSCCIH